MNRTTTWIRAFDEAIAMGFTALQAGLIADRTARELNVVG